MDIHHTEHDNVLIDQHCTAHIRQLSLRNHIVYCRSVVDPRDLSRQPVLLYVMNYNLSLMLSALHLMLSPKNDHFMVSVQ
jgi:hypothetical protein